MNRTHVWNNRTRFRALAGLILFGLVLFPLPIQAKVAPLDLPALIAGAEIIVLAEVQKDEVIATEGKLKTVRHTVKPLEVLKGKPEAGKPLTLSTLEFAGDRKLAPWHHPAAFPATGRRVLLFLQADPLIEAAPWRLADDYYGFWILGKDRFEDPSYPDLAALKALISKP